MMNQFVEGLQRVTALKCLQVMLQKDFLELLNSSIEDGNTDLVGLDVGDEFFLEVGVASLEGLLDDVMLVRLHFLIY